MGFNCGKEVLKICKSLHLYMRDSGCIRIGARAHVRSYAACARHATSSGAWRVLRSVEPLREHFCKSADFAFFTHRHCQEMLPGPVLG